MPMPMSIEWKLLTHGKEKRLENKENMFEIEFEGYKLFPLNQVIEIKRHHDSDQIGNGKIVELTWKNESTRCTYQLLSLYNVN
ncbi:DUF2584 family protein [Sediminibacillus albus]|uniref:DUF2584 domain-containing protein n=1 Tax=Sediminibacillus albus TaxID=407036 RepID=A0A1G8VRH3_9BACI|nr:DUF2584 family protein [Sediminibacillus albus]SDJ68594.1 Protein of unknown function [Sediminibacillus albus]